jgi:hypothetical protein
MLKKILTAMFFIFTFWSAVATETVVDEWTFIGKTADGTLVYTTVADSMTDGSIRMFLKGQKETKTKKIIKSGNPFPILIHCDRKEGRDFKAGVFGDEYYIPWEPLVPGSYGAIAFKAFCKNQ